MRAAVADICDINPRLHEKPADDEPVAFVGMADLDEIEAVAANPEVRPYAEVAKGYTPFTNGDLLVAKITPCFQNNKIGQARTSTRIAFGSTEFHVLRPREGAVDGRYLLHMLRHQDVLRHGEMRMTGAGGQRRVPARFFKELTVPVPPMDEQRRIAAVLETVDGLRAKRRQALAMLDTLTQAIFIDMFGDPGEGRVEMVELESVADAPITRGIDQPGPDVDDGAPYLKTTDFGGPAPRREDLARAAPEIAAKFPRSVVTRGDSVVCIRATVGPTLFVDEALDGVNLSRGTARVSPSSDVLPKYLFTALNSMHFQRQIKEKLRGATFLQIPLKELKTLHVPLPPISRQRELVDAIEGVEAQVALASSSQDRLGELFASLQQRAFRGEL